jgi:hypothetical protein
MASPDSRYYGSVQHVARSPVSLLLVPLLALAGCQLVTGLGSLETDPGHGGAGGNIVATSSDASGESSSENASSTSSNAATSGSSATSSSVGSSVASSAVSSAASSSASTGTGGMTPLTPCGNYTDDFATLDPTKWTIVNAIGTGGRVNLTPGNAQNAGHISLKPAQVYDHCYATATIINAPNSPIVYVGIEDSSGGQTSGVGYNGGMKQLYIDLNPAMSSNNVKSLGVAFSGGQVYYLFYDGSAWTVVGQVARPAWMDDGADDQVGMRCLGFSGMDCIVDDFNGQPITLADLN